MSAKYVSITKCPKCNGKHRYRLEVNRSIVMKHLTISDLGECPRSVPVTRLFTCPKTGEDFQAKFTLKETSSDRIKRVSVAGEVGSDDQQ